jgi:hypothetical protein
MSDQTIVEQMKQDLGQWNLGHLVMVRDAGFNSAENQKMLLWECGDYIIGEKLRVGMDGAAVEALHRKGRYRRLENGLAIKDVVLDAGKATERRFIIVKNPKGGNTRQGYTCRDCRNRPTEACRTLAV